MRDLDPGSDSTQKNEDRHFGVNIPGASSEAFDK
jgi:hypothetical protein